MTIRTKSRIAISASVLAVALLAFSGVMAQTPVANYNTQPPYRFTTKYEVPSALVPATATDPFLSGGLTGSVALDYGAFTNVSTSNCLLTIQTQQGSPVTILKALIPGYSASTPAANNYVINWGGMTAASGIKWSACDGSSIVGYVRAMR